MPYKYVAYDDSNRVVKGTIAVQSEEIAKGVLEQSGYRLLSLKSVRVDLNLRHQLPSFFAVKSRDIVSFSRMLATLVSRGTNTLVALQILRDQISNVTLQEVIEEVSDDVRRGINLSDAMGRHPDVFTPIYCRTIRVSEQTGSLELALTQMADYMEKEGLLKSKVARSLAYPMFLLAVGIGVIALLMTITLPALSQLFLDLGGELPLPTRILIAVTGFVNSYILVFPGMIVITVITGIWAFKKPGTRVKIDETLMKMPLIGPIVTLREMIQFSRTLSTCLASSIPMPETLALTVETARNVLMAKVLESARNQVLQGRSLSDFMKMNPVFPRPLVQIIKVGEEAGTLQEDLKTIAEMYEFEIDKRLSTMLGILAPAIMLFLGAFVAFIAVSMITPIYTVLGQVE
jgi:type IV pilus assembly protein PilC